MKSGSLKLILLLSIVSCSTSPISEDITQSTSPLEDRSPANIKENWQDIVTLLFNEDAYGENKTIARSLIDKAIILSNGKIGARKSAQLRRRSHQALFNYYFPLTDLPESVDPAQIAQLSKKLFENYSRNESMSKFHLVLEDLSFFATNRSYNVGHNAGEHIKELVRKDQQNILKFLETVNKNSFADLSVAEQTEFLNLFKNSEVQNRRAMHFKIRALYMSGVYDSAIGEKIVGIKLPSKVRGDLDAFMKAHPLNIPKVKAMNKYDVIVVGSGPAGSVIAHELIKKGKSVLLLEGGSFYHPGTIETRQFSEFRESMGNRFTDDESIIFRAGNVAGGGSSVNIDLAFSPELPEVKKQLDLWRKLGHIEEDQFTPEKIKVAYSYISKKVGTRTPSINEINTNNSVLYDGAVKSGFTPKMYDLNTYMPSENVGSITDKKSALEAFILPAMTNKENPLHFRPDAVIEKVLFAEDGETVRGVKVKIHKPVNVPGVIDNPMGMNFPLDQSFEIEAEQVILSAGGIGTPKILLESGIKNKNIGKHLVAHPSMPISGKFEKDISLFEGTPSTVYAPRDGFILESTSASPGYAAVMMPEGPNEVRKRLKSFNHYAGFGVMVVDESSMDNRVYFDKNNRLQIHYELTDKDKAIFINGLVDAATAMFNAGAIEVLIPSTENYLLDASGNSVMRSLDDVEKLRKNLKLIKSKNVITSAHIQGTARMGTSPTNSVVNPHQEVWGTKNLFVADSSIHPYSIGANPMQAIYTFAKIFADSL